MELSKPNKINVPYEVEKGVPIPPLERNKAYLFPFDKMEVGDSFKIILVLKENPEKKYKQLASAVNTYRKKHPDKKYSIRTLVRDECIRCWRIQ